MIIFSKQVSFRALLVFMLLLFVCSLSAQDASVKPGTAATPDETAIYLDPAAGTGTVANNANVASSADTIWILVRIVLVLIIVCAGIYGVVYLLKKSTRINAGNDPYLKNVATLSLSPNKSVRIITAGSQAFVIGVTDQSISLISELADKELIDAMNLETDRVSSVPAGTFMSVLQAFLPKKIRGNESESETQASGESESALATTNFLRRQRERLRNGRPE